MDAAHGAKHNLLGALASVAQVHLVIVYYMDASLLWLLLRFAAQFWLLPQSPPLEMRTLLIAVLLVNIICGSRRMSPPDEQGFIIDFIGRAPTSGRVLLLICDVFVLLLQMLQIFVLYQATDTEMGREPAPTGPRVLGGEPSITERTGRWMRWWSRQASDGAEAPSARSYDLDRHTSRRSNSNSGPARQAPIVVNPYASTVPGRAPPLPDRSLASSFGYTSRASSSLAASPVRASHRLGGGQDDSADDATEAAEDSATRQGALRAAARSALDRMAHATGRSTAGYARLSDQATDPVAAHEDAASSPTTYGGTEQPSEGEAYALNEDLGGLLVLHPYDTLRQYWARPRYIDAESSEAPASDTRSLPV
ncbi:hypothetical protein THASP1DRAFT_29392 [Thamnocephalis sphaerospora]|uniref:DUF1746 domain-containing protein n=1 Tax=Thamnocephalis sphaerospora TaxID=78915 RepID=A0A4P9XRU1_9FUNG|nr:hypothetical protein THASP1DRAFT_29392 [Thamnocephalis sphaerospora]|eukprot:RKP08816.1 hypothetical protein THASP1DRAFT_29392 [Thamnocephalis sphaerospora]